jgi:hypothetical protein
MVADPGSTRSREPSPQTWIRRAGIGEGPAEWVSSTRAEFLPSDGPNETASGDGKPAVAPATKRRTLTPCVPKLLPFLCRDELPGEA